MVNFSKKIAVQSIEKKTNPIEIYSTLDRKSDKGPLRPAQEAILTKWYKEHRKDKEVVIKLNTGQGKTLIGLLILQSRLNEGIGPLLYLCPNKYLVQQTCQQAESFGIPYTTSETGLPDEFINSKKIFITTVNKLFNGFSLFGTGANSLHVGTIIVDDAHACIDRIRDAYSIKLDMKSNPYNEILELFSSELEQQGLGTYQDILQNEYEAFTPVPYWAWLEKLSGVVKILARYKKMQSIKYSWPLLKDILQNCSCIISGNSIEITPYIPPLDIFCSYTDAYKVFMSASLIDDAFFIKGLNLNPEVVRNPLVYQEEGWSGEKMILIPSEIDDSLGREKILERLARPNVKRKYGVVVLSPSNKRADEWQGKGAIKTNTKTIFQIIEDLKKGKFSETIVMMNSYDGIDLPDNLCRILVVDSIPYTNSLLERYYEQCRSTSNISELKKIIKIEQGFGRGVRGEKDYCAIIVLDETLVKFIKNDLIRKYFSTYTKTQIEIGLEIVQYAIEETESDAPLNVLIGLVGQVITRDEGWKKFYAERMSTARDSDKLNVSNLLTKEKEAEIEYQFGDPKMAVSIVQEIIDHNSSSLDDFEKGWYLQEMARYTYGFSKTNSLKLQREAYKKNRYLLKVPPIYNSQHVKSQKRIKNIHRWLKKFESYAELQQKNTDILRALTFGTKADEFEAALDKLGEMLGFETDRPDKKNKNGPDNLWKLKDNEYIIFECKSEVDINRKEINKEEANQINASSIWFEKKYKDSRCKKILIINTRKLSKSASVSSDISVMTSVQLRKLVQNVRNFICEFSNYDLKDLDEDKIQEYLVMHHLDINHILDEYSIILDSQQTLL